MSADIKARFQELNKVFQVSAKDYFRCMTYGDPGTGKTTCLRTVPFPLHVDCFDSGGARNLADLADQGLVIVEDFSKEDPDSPSQFKAWFSTMARRRKEGYWDYFASYALDGVSSLTNSLLLNHIKTERDKAREKKRDYEQPAQQDWYPVMFVLEKCFRSLALLPCHVFVNAHAQLRVPDQPGRQSKDLDGKVMKFFPALPGRLHTSIIGMFDEVYYSHTKRMGTEVKYQWNIKDTSDAVAKTRLANLEADIALTQPQSYAELLQKLNYEVKHKEKLF